jgi:hypothetical protein
LGGEILLKEVGLKWEVEVRTWARLTRRKLGNNREGGGGSVEDRSPT